MFKDYYLILEINPLSSNEEIKIAFKKQALKWHPDKNPGIDTTEKMQEINEAYLFLKDTEARKRYDNEYQKFVRFNSKKEKTSEQASNENFNEDVYDFDDEILKKWMSNAQKQAVDLAKQTIKEIRDLSIGATKQAGKKMFELFIGYFLVGIFFLIVFKACNN